MKGLHGILLLAVVTVAFVAACATVQSRWEATKSADTITAYEDFLKEYPEGDLADQGRVRRNELYEERDWKNAEANNTIAAYEDFVKNYPRGKHKKDVSARLDVLSAEKFLKRYPQGVFMNEALLTLEKLSFEQAITSNTISAYEDFLKRYPVGMLADDARRRQEKLNSDSLASEWGTIMYPQSNTNIRAKRSVASKLKGQLKTGQPVKVDFLQDAWYAVFPVTQKQRHEEMALGYVYATLLIDKRESRSSGSTASNEKSAKDAPLKKMDTESLSVDVKNITFKVAGNGKELLLIEFDRYYMPTIFGIEGKEPLIILEIKNASSLREDWAAINTGGNFIRQICTSMDSQTRAALIVLYMAPKKNYSVSPGFYKKGNMYSLEISAENEIRFP
jgi:outer membrane protein assembly factor BamD (BamD/ComL family)